MTESAFKSESAITGFTLRPDSIAVTMNALYEGGEEFLEIPVSYTLFIGHNEDGENNIVLLNNDSDDYIYASACMNQSTALNYSFALFCASEESAYYTYHGLPNTLTYCDAFQDAAIAAIKQDSATQLIKSWRHYNYDAVSSFGRPCQHVVAELSTYELRHELKEAFLQGAVDGDIDVIIHPVQFIALCREDEDKEVPDYEIVMFEPKKATIIGVVETTNEAKAFIKNLEDVFIAPHLLDDKGLPQHQDHKIFHHSKVNATRVVLDDVVRARSMNKDYEPDKFDIECLRGFQYREDSVALLFNALYEEADSFNNYLIQYDVLVITSEEQQTSVVFCGIGEDDKQELVVFSPSVEADNTFNYTFAQYLLNEEERYNAYYQTGWVVEASEGLREKMAAIVSTQALPMIMVTDRIYESLSSHIAFKHDINDLDGYPTLTETTKQIFKECGAQKTDGFSTIMPMQFIAVYCNDMRYQILMFEKDIITAITYCDNAALAHNFLSELQKTFIAPHLDHDPELRRVNQESPTSLHYSEMDVGQALALDFQKRSANYGVRLN